MKLVLDTVVLVRALRSLGVFEGMSICTAQTMIAVLAGRDERDATT